MLLWKTWSKNSLFCQWGYPRDHCEDFDIWILFQESIWRNVYLLSYYQEYRFWNWYYNECQFFKKCTNLTFNVFVLFMQRFNRMSRKFHNWTDATNNIIFTIKDNSINYGLFKTLCLPGKHARCCDFWNRLILRPAIKLMDRQQCFTKRTAITNIFKYFLELHFCESKNWLDAWLKQR